MVVRCRLEIHKGKCLRTVIPGDRVFNLYRATIVDSFSCIHLFRKLE